MLLILKSNQQMLIFNLITHHVIPVHTHGHLLYISYFFRVVIHSIPCLITNTTNAYNMLDMNMMKDDGNVESYSLKDCKIVHE